MFDSKRAKLSRRQYNISLAQSSQSVMLEYVMSYWFRAVVLMSPSLWLMQAT